MVDRKEETMSVIYLGSDIPRLGMMMIDISIARGYYVTRRGIISL